MLSRSPSLLARSLQSFEHAEGFLQHKVFGTGANGDGGSGGTSDGRLGLNMRLTRPPQVLTMSAEAVQRKMQDIEEALGCSTAQVGGGLLRLPRWDA